MLLHRFPELSQTFVLDQITALEEAGFEVDVFAAHLSKDGLRHAKGREAAKRAHFANRAFLARLSKLPIVPEATREIIQSRARNRLFQRAAGDYDLLLCHFGPNGLRATRTASRMEHPAPIWTIFHGYDVSYYLQARGDAVYDPLFRAGDRFLPISKLWAEKLVSLGCPPERIQLLRMGVDCEAIPYNYLDISVNEPVRILSVGRLTEKKGTEFSLRALAKLKREQPNLDWNFDVVGDGPLDAELRTLAAELGIASEVRFLGPRPSAEVKQLLARANIFLLPSVVSSNGDMEGIPVALMEAMAAGVPAVSTFHSGIPELIDHGQSGLLAPERDVHTLAAHLETMITDRAKRRAIAEAARNKVEAEFNQVRINTKFAESIETALLARRSSQGIATSS